MIKYKTYITCNGHYMTYIYFTNGDLQNTNTARIQPGQNPGLNSHVNQVLFVISLMVKT